MALYRGLYKDSVFYIQPSNDHSKHVYIKSENISGEMFLWMGFKGLIPSYKNYKMLGVDVIE